MSEKEVRHQKMNEFKKEISSVANRNRKIQELTTDINTLSELERLKVTTLLKKASLVPGCESAYQALINRIKKCDDAKLIELAQALTKKTGLVF